MKAGHELDVLVAEKLFNHKVYRVPDYGPPVYIAEVKGGGEHVLL